MPNEDTTFAREWQSEVLTPTGRYQRPPEIQRLPPRFVGVDPGRGPDRTTLAIGRRTGMTQAAGEISYNMSSRRVGRSQALGEAVHRAIEEGHRVVVADPPYGQVEPWMQGLINWTERNLGTAVREEEPEEPPQFVLFPRMRGPSAWAHILAED